MTMDPSVHPADERLAALADDDREARVDAALLGHVDGCARCATFVDDLRALRSALAELPDLVPSRPLRLLPPVSLEPRRGGFIGSLRRLAAPTLAIGILLAVVGAVGSAGSLGFGASAGAPPAFSSLNESRAGAAAPSTTQQPPAIPGAAVGGTPSPSSRANSLDGVGSPTPSAAERSNATPTPGGEPSGEQLGAGDGAARDASHEAGSLYPLVLLLGLGLAIAGGVAMIVERRIPA